MPIIVGNNQIYDNPYSYSNIYGKAYENKVFIITAKSSTANLPFGKDVFIAEILLIGKAKSISLQHEISKISSTEVKISFSLYSGNVLIDSSEFTEELNNNYVYDVLIGRKHMQIMVRNRRKGNNVVMKVNFVSTIEKFSFSSIINAETFGIVDNFGKLITYMDK